MAYVITCGDEGVQVNQGTRFSFVGSGFKLEGFDEAVAILKKIVNAPICIAACEENDWTKKELDVSTWEQTNASAQQHVEALADRLDLTYIKMIPFTDPKELGGEIKAHMVRPKGIHVANKICFTIGGGENIYNLGQFQISADWVSKASDELVKKVLDPQIEFYESLVGGKKLEVIIQESEVFGVDTANANREKLTALGYL
ncbi:MAG: hypothetical protein WAU07_02850 [Microgenomates group bacterium]